MNRYFPVIILIGLFYVGHVHAQSIKDPVKEYENFRRQMQKEYNDFRDKANAEYVEFMRKAWQWYESEPAIPAPKIPDPPKPPVVIPEKDKDKTPDNKPIPYDEVIPAPVVIEQPKPVAPILETPKPKKEEWFDFTVFGTACKVRLSDTDRFRLYDCRENTIADMWQKLSQPQYNNLIRDCLELRIRLNLCDWAYLKMLEHLASDFLGKNTNESVLLSSFLYNQSGYKARIARSQTNGLYLLISSRHIIYKLGYYKIGNENFFALNCPENGLFIYDNAYVKEQPLSLLIGKEQLFTLNASVQKKLQSKRYPAVSAMISSNKNLIEFYNSYPQSFINSDETTKWTFYANTPLCQFVKEALYPILKNTISGKSERDAANILINFVQTAFEYEYDDVVWGEDRPFFADETIHHPYSDCEDRAILFSRLVRDLMGLKVVLLYYPGHLASAVQFTENITGDYLIVDNNKYIVCDPTYIGANIGLTMPEMDNAKAKVVVLD